MTNERVTEEFPRGTPGSLEAIKEGCPRMDNSNGLGMVIGGVRQFWRAVGCPVHPLTEEHRDD